MAKFGISQAQPGVATEAEQKVAAGSPVQDLKERTPQAESSFDALIDPNASRPIDQSTREAVEAGVLAGIDAEEKANQQREAERIAPIGERARDKSVKEWEVAQTPILTKPKKNFTAVDASAEADAGIWGRAKNVSDQYAAGNIGFSLKPSKEAFTAGREAAPEERSEAIASAAPEGSLIAAVNRSGSVVNEVTDTGNIVSTIDPKFLQMSSIVTEKVLSDLAFNVDPKQPSAIDQALQEDIEAAPLEDTNRISKAQSNDRLGHEIHREYMRWKNSQEGKPTDDYQDLTHAEATTLGDAAKELYFAANEGNPGSKFMERTHDPKTRQTYFSFTKLGLQQLKDGEQLRKTIFPKINVKPLANPSPTGHLLGEQAKYRKAKSGTVGTPANRGTIEAAIRNLSTVANVVDKQRLKILYTTLLPVLSGRLPQKSVEANAYDIGDKKQIKFENEERKKKAENPYDEYTADGNMNSLRSTIAQAVRSIAQQKDQVNYLTYYTQDFQGRIAPQQTYFDPTTSKVVRFVTRNAEASVASPGSRVERNLRQMYAMMLVKGADLKLPHERERMLAAAETELEAWGDRLSALLDNAITDDQVNQISEAIDKGVSLTSPDFPVFNNLALDPVADEKLINAIKGKKEDGPHFIDGVMDFAKYIKAKKAGKPYRSYFNAYMDGKTNGIASNGIQMGSLKVARATGVLRSDEMQGDLLDKGDIRDQLNVNLLNSLDQGFDGDTDGYTAELHDVAQAVYSYRQLNKDTTMTFGYGKELGSFKKDIESTIDYLDGVAKSGDPEAIAEFKLDTYAQSLQTLRDKEIPLTDTLHTKYIPGLAQVLSKDALDSRALVRSAAVLHGITNQLFSIKSYTGFDLNIGGMESLGWSDADAVEYAFTKEGKKHEIKVGQYKSEPTSAAIRLRKGVPDVGGEAYGGSVPAPVQSLDAATVALTSSGRSWEKLKHASNGKPYLHTIYDAFKVDANGYDVVLDEVNNNWFNAAMKWSYLEETYKSTREAMNNFWTEINKLDPEGEINLGPTDSYRMMGDLLDPSESKSGTWPSKLQARLYKLIPQPKGMKKEVYNKMIFDGVLKIKNILEQEGYKVGSPTAKVRHLKTFVREMENLINLNPRLSQMISKTNRNKERLRKEVKKRGPVRQYYAH